MNLAKARYAAASHKSRCGWCSHDQSGECETGIILQDYIELLEKIDRLHELDRDYDCSCMRKYPSCGCLVADFNKGIEEAKQKLSRL